MKLKIKTRKQFLETYEKEAAIYDKERSSTFEGRVVDHLQRKFVLKQIRKNNSKKILEAGCGTGRILSFLAQKNLRCFGIDPSKNMLAQFKKKIRKNKLKITLKEGSIEKIPFKPNTFDLTYTIHVLMHMPDYKKAFKDMYRVTKKGGIVIADFPNKDSPWTKLSLFFNPKKKRTHLYTIKEVKDSLKEYDYEITGLFSYPKTLYKIVLLRWIILLLEKILPLPVAVRTQLFFIIKKH